ncbi:2-succinyl-5-enolpyruvyl-6-hydroxy-3-cyclohexene-1-carboxylic-acid synthase [Thiorhodospira sibirica]|uniref:2-succinyl-5-enolpyruvyl-6-hydroxy-3- cyclohexene-1-carboxylic-acid synthase n=1 Tax=Thiorhodospira sibirica TaxID=154347 RepID=UPI00022C2DBC|nr:2-succinyl-5-enolpyruvyl-6-hydroxy-3-cyclohexene-1-carboxylic-acid synthase [Thiorhodospira sibirica]
MSERSCTLATLNLHWCEALFAGLAQGGLSDCVISPGSRSTPLVLAADRHPWIRTHVCLDERVAGFMALGLALRSQRPVALVATSGSAPAHWYPAVMEAHHVGASLILLSADRPPELHGFGANQTTDQQRLFGTHLRAFYDPGAPRDDDHALRYLHALAQQACLQSRWPHPGPVQINLPVREPLVPEQWPAALCTALAPRSQLPPLAKITPDPHAVAALATQMRQGPGLILCGPGQYPAGFAEALMALQQTVNAPVLADPLSGLRFGTHLDDPARVCVHYDAWLRCATALPEPPAWVLQFGRMPVSQALANYLKHEALPLRYLVNPYAHWPDPLHRSHLPLLACPLALCQALLAQSWPAPSPNALYPRCLALESQTQTYATHLLQHSEALFEGHLIRALLEVLPAETLLFSSNSLPIRQLDTWSGSRRAPLHVFANRGLSGIDGNLATLLGLAQAHDTGPVVGLLGDLALVHDLGALVKAQGQSLLLIVINNGGGGIFGYLPQAHLESFSQYWHTPHPLDLRALAGLFGAQYFQLTERAQLSITLDAALTAPGLRILEVVVDATYSQTTHRTYWQTLATLQTGLA